MLQVSLSSEVDAIAGKLIHPIESMSSLSILVSKSLTCISVTESVLEVIDFLLLLESDFLLWEFYLSLLFLFLLSTKLTPSSVYIWVLLL